MNKKDLANRFKISLATIYNWEKEKPELIRIINLGLQVEEQIEETEKYLERLKEMKEKAGGKLII